MRSQIALSLPRWVQKAPKLLFHYQGGGEPLPDCSVAPEVGANLGWAFTILLFAKEQKSKRAKKAIRSLLKSNKERVAPTSEARRVITLWLLPPREQKSKKRVRRSHLRSEKAKKSKPLPKWAIRSENEHSLPKRAIFEKKNCQKMTKIIGEKNRIALFGSKLFFLVANHSFWEHVTPT